VFDMLKATRWPKGGSGRVVLCVLGRDPFGGAWRSIDGRPLGKGKLDVVPVQGGSDLARCHALFVSTSARARWPQIRGAVGARPVRPPSQMMGVAPGGGMVARSKVGNPR